MREMKVTYASLLPGLSKEEFEALKADIKANGQREPAIVDHEGNILDGCHRYKILGAKLRTVVLPGSKRMTDAERKAFVLRANLNRRQLSPTQIAELERQVLKPLANELRWGPEWAKKKAKTIRTEAEVGKLLGRPRETIRDWTKRNTTIGGTANGCIPRADIKIPKSERAAIWQRWRDGWAQQLIADDYHTTQQRIAAICRAETRRREMERKKKRAVKASRQRPRIRLGDWRDWISSQPDCDLLLTDPPYSTDVDDVASFASGWLPVCIRKVKPTGRAYVCIGAYPKELLAYISLPLPGHMSLEQVLVWCYRNTIGPSSKQRYNLNWQAVLYYVGADAPPLNCDSLNEQFSVQDINAPDGRHDGRYHAWQKPDELAERFVRHATEPGQFVMDPFAGTGTFIIAAAKLGRIAAGCEINKAMLDIAIERGCVRSR